MKHLLTILIVALTCATLHAQSVIVKGTGAGAVHATGAGSVRGVVINWGDYCDGRFTVAETNQDVVLDNDSGLTWARDANIAGGPTNWQAAINYCSNLTYATYDDWRLPGVTNDAGTGEFNTLFETYPSEHEPALPLGHPFTDINVTGEEWNGYWSSTPVSVHAYRISAINGRTDVITISYPYYVWPCRGP